MQMKMLARRETAAKVSEAERIYQRLLNCGSIAWIGDGKIHELALSSKLLEIVRGHVIYSTGERPSHVYIVLSGCVTIRYSYSRTIEAVFGPDDILGLASSVAPSRYKSLAVATLNSKLARLSPAKFIETVLGISADKFIRTLSMAGGRYLELAGNYRIVAKSLKMRIAFELLNLAEKFGIPDARGILLNLPLTHKFIADLVAASRPRVSKAMAELQRNGSVTRVDQRLILNVESLRAVLHEASDILRYTAEAEVAS
jgi:CRP/FNR family transcriptional regulator, cyclic AMP receptor protein